MKRNIAHGLFFAAAFPDWLRWQACRRQPEHTQQRRLLQILNANANTEFGRRHGFGSIRTVRDYQSRVGLADYESFSEPIQRMRGGEHGLLCAERPRVFQPTSGSTGAGKLLPYTASLKREFLLGINPWLCDLYMSHPRLFGGKAYWQISPAVDPAGDNSDGFVDDAEYLGPIAQRVWSEISAVPDIVRWVADPSSFRYLSALYLLRAGDLRLISIWSPSFLSLILETIRTHAAALLGDIQMGRISVDLRLPKKIDDRHSLALDPLPKRADELEPLLRAESICWKEVWPQLALISCWSDGFASHLVPRILREFCDVPIQGKGLLATEGIVSFPLHGSPDGCVPAINSHFFEFCELEGGTPRLVEELQAGEQYTVVITTSGGLYRYRLHDIVRVVGFSGRLPLLRFVGREQGVSDFFGEKLHESHVSELVTKAFASHPEFALFVCEEFPEGFCYCLILQSPVLSESERRALLERLETGLLENIHYRYCRQLGQLGPLRLFYQEQGLERYIAELRKGGIREGNIKPGLLARGQGWVQRLGSVEA